MFLYTENTTNPITASKITIYNTNHTKHAKINLKVSDFVNRENRKINKTSFYFIIHQTSLTHTLYILYILYIYKWLDNWLAVGTSHMLAWLESKLQTTKKGWGMGSASWTFLLQLIYIYIYIYYIQINIDVWLFSNWF